MILNPAPLSWFLHLVTAAVATATTAGSKFSARVFPSRDFAGILEDSVWIWARHRRRIRSRWQPGRWL